MILLIIIVSLLAALYFFKSIGRRRKYRDRYRRESRKEKFDRMLSQIRDEDE